MRDCTLVFLIKGKPIREILLGMKKRGFGVGKYNGFGGKVNKDEKIEDAAVREMHEETGVVINKDNMRKMAELTFIFPDKSEWDQLVHVFFVDDWNGEPRESEEMTAEWIDSENLPYERMWDDDIHWMPLVLKNKKITGKFFFNENGKMIRDFKLEEAVL